MNNKVKFNRYLLALLVFASGAVVMIVELVGSRLLAPYFGSSIVVWTSLIGVILLSLSAGYYLGGWLADRWPKKKLLSYLVFSAGLFIVLVPYIFPQLFSVVLSLKSNLVLMSLLASLGIFLIPNIFMGTILPFVTKIFVKDINKIGINIGLIYALSTLGSIFGVFLAGYYLIPTFGTNSLLFFMGLLMVIFSIVIYLEDYIKLLLALFLLTLIFLYPSVFIYQENIIARAESEYNSLQVIEQEKNDQIFRYLKANNTYQSAICLNCEDGLENTYQNYRMNFCFNPDIKNVLIIGGGGYSMAIDMLERYDIERLDVVEIDPEMTRLAREYFGLPNDPRLHIFHQDGRMYINQYDGDKYDLIIIDVFLHSFSLPFHLTTVETVEKVKNMMNEDGIVFINTISSLEGANSRFLRAEYDTYSRFFENVSVYPMDSENNERVQNIFLVAKNHLWEIDCQDAHLRKFVLSLEYDKMLLSDDYAPVNSLLFDFYY